MSRPRASTLSSMESEAVAGAVHIDGGVQMKLIMAVIKPHKLDDVRMH